MGFDGEMTLLVGFTLQASDLVEVRKHEVKNCEHAFDRIQVKYCPECGKYRYKEENRYLWIDFNLKALYEDPVSFYDIRETLEAYYSRFEVWFPSMTHGKALEDNTYFIGVKLGTVSERGTAYGSWSQADVAEALGNYELQQSAKQWKQDLRLYLLNTSTW